MAEGRNDEATTLLHEALLLKRQLNDQLGLALSLEFLAWVAVAQGRPERAATLMGAAGTIWSGLGVSLSTLPPFSGRRHESEGAVRAMLPGNRFEEAVRVGAAMDTPSAIAFGLESEDKPEARKDSGPDRRTRKASGPSGVSPLTAREREVAGLVAGGLTNQQIADRLVLSPRTAEAHVENILRKLGFTSRLAIASWVAEHKDELAH